MFLVKASFKRRYFHSVAAVEIVGFPGFELSVGRMKIALLDRREHRILSCNLGRLSLNFIFVFLQSSFA